MIIFSVVLLILYGLCAGAPTDFRTRSFAERVFWIMFLNAEDVRVLLFFNRMLMNLIQYTYPAEFTKSPVLFIEFSYFSAFLTL